jgi:hypothetical protein
MEPLKYDQILLNEPIYLIEKAWGRKLSDHERDLVILTYRITRTSQEAEEIKILEHGERKAKNDALYKIHEIIQAMTLMQTEVEFAKVYCSVIEKHTKEIEELVEKI